jgi:hypothetical protein
VHVPLQHVFEALHAPPAATHLLPGAFGEGPDAASAAASLPARKGNTVPATLAARIFRALRRVTGFASFLARSSKRSALMSSFLAFSVLSLERAIEWPLIEKSTRVSPARQRVQVTQTPVRSDPKSDPRPRKPPKSVDSRHSAPEN